MPVNQTVVEYQINANGLLLPVYAQTDGSANVVGSIPYQVVNGVFVPVSSAAPLPVAQLNQTGTLSIPVTGLGHFVGIPLANNISFMSLSFLGFAGGAELNVSISIDNGATYQSREIFGGVTSISANGQYFVLVAGCTNIGFAVGVIGTGSVALTYCATSAPGIVGIQPGSFVAIDQTTPGTSNAVVTSPGNRTLVPLDINSVTTGGAAVVALNAGHRTAGGWIYNPENATVNLGINEIGTASGTTSNGNTTFIYPGGTYVLAPSGNAVSVISSDSAHPFSGIGLQ